MTKAIDESIDESIERTMNDIRKSFADTRKQMEIAHSRLDRIAESQRPGVLNCYFVMDTHDTPRIGMTQLKQLKSRPLRPYRADQVGPNGKPPSDMA